MTNKEAIEILSNRLNTYYCTDEDLKALDLAIKALRIVESVNMSFEHDYDNTLMIDICCWEDIKQIIEDM